MLNANAAVWSWFHSWASCFIHSVNVVVCLLSATWKQKPEEEEEISHFSTWPLLTTWLCLCVCVCVWVVSVCVCFVSQDSYSSQCVSQPPTPSPMSPSSASLSSCHGEDSDSISSPAWPKTPTSPVSAAKHNNSFSFLCIFKNIFQGSTVFKCQVTILRSFFKVLILTMMF